MKPASHCDDCAHWDRESDTYTADDCKMGHRPRFFVPRGPLDSEYGFKRRCDDFERGEHVQVVKI